MVTRCSCRPVWGNNNSLISFYHSLSNRQKSFANSLVTLSSRSLLCLLLPSLSSPSVYSPSVWVWVSFSITSATCLCAGWNTEHTQESIIHLHKWPISVSLCAFNRTFIYLKKKSPTPLLTSEHCGDRSGYARLAPARPHSKKQIVAIGFTFFNKIHFFSGATTKLNYFGRIMWVEDCIQWWMQPLC